VCVSALLISGGGGGGNCDSVYGAVVMGQPLWEFTLFILWTQNSAKWLPNAQTKPTNNLYPSLPFIIMWQLCRLEMCNTAYRVGVQPATLGRCDNVCFTRYR